MALSKEERAYLESEATKKHGSDYDFAKLSDADLADVFDSEGSGKTQETQAGPSTGDYALRSLDYERVAGAAGLAKLLGQYNPEEFAKAGKMQGNIPSSQELYERAGLADKNSIGGFLSGLATDMATSPSTYASFGTAAAVKNMPRLAKAAELLKYLNPVGEVVNQGVGKTLKYGGGKIYKSAFSDLDKVAKDAARSGKPAFLPSDLAREGKVRGWTSESIKDQFQDLLTNYGNQRENLLKTGTVPFDENVMAQPVLDEIKRLGTSIEPADQDRAQELGTWLTKVMDNIKNRGGATAEEMNEFRQRVDKNMPSMYSGESSAAKELGQAKAGAARTEAARMSANPALFDELGQKQKVLFDTMEKQQDLANRGLGIDRVGAFDVGLAIYDPKFFAVKKGIETLAKQGPRSMIGAGTEATGDFLLKNPWLIKTPIRQSFVDSGRDQ